MKNEKELRESRNCKYCENCAECKAAAFKGAPDEEWQPFFAPVCNNYKSIFLRWDDIDQFEIAREHYPEQNIIFDYI